MEAQVAARPTDFVTGTIPSGYDADLDGLVRGLSAINPALEKYAEKKSDENRKEGEVARAGGQALDESKGADWVHGYMALDGKVKGEADAAEVWSAYQTKFDKDGGDLEAFIKEHWEGRTKGLQAGAFLDGYRDSFVPMLTQLRSEHLKYQQQRVTDTVESNAMQLLDGGVRAYINAGQPVPDEYIEAIRGHLNGNLGVSNSRFNDLLFEAIKRLGDEGNYAIYDMLKRPRPDGTPGMYNIPAWKEKIDQAQIHAQSVYLSKARAADEAARKEREDRQDQAMLAVFLEEDPKKATAMFNDHVRNGMFDRASEYISWGKKLEEKVDGKPSIPQMDVELEILQGIYARKVKPRDIFKADITRSQRKYLLNELEQARNHDRTIAAQGDITQKRIFSSYEFRSGEDYIKGMLASSPSTMDPFGVGSSFERQQRAEALLEFTQRAGTAKSPSELNAIREDIVGRYQQRRRDTSKEAMKVPGAGRIRYSSPAEVRANADRLSDEELAVHLNYFKTLRANPKQ